jgi:hypothetical protein
MQNGIYENNFLLAKEKVAFENFKGGILFKTGKQSLNFNGAHLSKARPQSEIRSRTHD